MKIRNLFYAMLWAVVDGVRAEYNRPVEPGRWGTMQADARRYLAPLTGTAKGLISGIRQEMNRRRRW